MNWTVQIKLGRHVGSYSVTASKYYEAKIEALKLFLQEFKIPGKAYEFLTTKKDLVEVSVKSSEDRRMLTRETPTTDFYLSQVDMLIKSLRTGKLDRSVKKKGVGILYDLREVLSGTGVS